MENIMSSKLFTTRQGTILLGVIAALIAAVALIVYLHNYRNSVNGSNAVTKVMVAKQLIQKDTPGEVVGTNSMYQFANIAKSEVKTGAFVDPSTLAGKVASVDIYPGQQITSADFAAGTASLTTHLSDVQRAVTISLGSAQTVGGQLASGSHVDVWISSGTTSRLLFQDMYVLSIDGGNVTFRASPAQAGALIFASQNSQIWLVLRPTVGNIVRRPPVIRSSVLGH